MKCEVIQKLAGMVFLGVTSVECQGYLLVIAIMKIIIEKQNNGKDNYIDRFI